MISTFLSASSLNRTNARVEGVALHVQTHLLERVGERVASGMLAQHDLRRLLTDRRRIDDLVGLAVGEHAVLMDSRLVRERVAADNCLVELHVVAGEARDHPRRARELLGLHTHGAILEVVAARLDRHHHFLERGVAGALAQTVHRALDLAGAVRHAGERVGDREAEVVVAVRGDDEVAASPCSST